MAIRLGARWRAPSAAWLATERITDGRPAVQREWSRAVADAHAGDPDLPPEAPGYFWDRHAFARLGRPRHIADNPVPGFDLRGPYDRVRLLSSYCVRARTLQDWRPQPERPTGVGEFYQELRSQWAAFANAVGLPGAAAVLPNAAEGTWKDVFDQSVFYPRGPAIPGATFHDLISDKDRQAIRDRYGAQGPIDFYCFIQQVHEIIHVVQTGEPLLNEVVQASMWVEFLDRNPDLWLFQRNSETGRSAVRELALVRKLPCLWQQALAARLDTAAMVDHRAVAGAYFVLCLWANRFDSRQLRYAGYLSGVSRTFEISHDDRQIGRLASHLLRASTAQRLKRLRVPRI